MTNVKVYQSDSAANLYSSGTTGRVKGVELTHRNFIALIAGFYDVGSIARAYDTVQHLLLYIKVRPSVTFMISEPCACYHATRRVEALETSFSKIEHEICRLLVARGLTRGAFEVKPLTDDKDYNSQHQVAISMLQPTKVHIAVHCQHHHGKISQQPIANSQYNHPVQNGMPRIP